MKESLGIVLFQLFKALDGYINETKISEISGIIQNFAIAAAVAGVVSGMVPGLAAVIAMLTQTGLVWATYVKINKTLGISMKENTAKFIGSAIVTNIALNAGTVIVAYATSLILSFIPVVNHLVTATIDGVMGFIIVYVAAIIYLKLIVRLVKPDGTIEVDESEDTKEIIREIVKESDLKKLIKEGKDEFKKAKADGLIEKAKKNPKCPNCDSDIQLDQLFCSKCGIKLK